VLSMHARMSPEVCCAHRMALPALVTRIELLLQQDGRRVDLGTCNACAQCCGSWHVPHGLWTVSACCMCTRRWLTVLHGL
jgi:hypothetical protein